MYAEMQVTGRRPGSTGVIAQRGSKDGHQVVQDGHARYYQAVYDGNVYTGANPAGTAVTTQAGLSATTPVLSLYNPIGSGVNLVLWKTNIVLVAAPAAASTIMLAFNLASAAAPSSLTSANITNNLIGNAATSKGLCSRVSTLAATPVAFEYLATATAASLVAYDNNVFWHDGAFILVPGACISVQTTTAASMLAGFTWEEVEI